jgi:hypothetical protein
VLKTPSRALQPLKQGLKTTFSQCFGLVSGLFLTTDRADIDFFNSVPWPLPGHTEAMKMDPSPY